MNILRHVRLSLEIILRGHEAMRAMRLGQLSG